MTPNAEVVNEAMYVFQVALKTAKERVYSLNTMRNVIPQVIDRNHILAPCAEYVVPILLQMLEEEFAGSVQHKSQAHVLSLPRPKFRDLFPPEEKEDGTFRYVDGVNGRYKVRINSCKA